MSAFSTDHQVIGRIIDDLQDYKKSLAACSLVCKSWGDISAHHLFQRITISSRNKDEPIDLNDLFTLFLSSGSVVKLANQYTRELHVVGQFEDRLLQRRLETLLRNLPNLETLHLAKFRLTITHRLFMTPAALCTTTLRTIGFTSIVADYTVEEAPIILESVFTNIERLEILGITDLVIDPPVSTLKSFKVNHTVTDIHPINILIEISCNGPMSNLTHLDLCWIKSEGVALVFQALDSHFKRRLIFLRVGYDHTIVNP